MVSHMASEMDIMESFFWPASHLGFHVGVINHV